METRSRASRTVNPLHFEDIEPHRFEDLVRQLAHSFRTWRHIDASGRFGHDFGRDVRAKEIGPSGEERDWFIQVKREQRLGPADMPVIVREAVREFGTTPYGLVIAAACDVSEKSFLAFRSEAENVGIEEAHFWGKAYLEDQLLTKPEHAGLLYAYFDLAPRASQEELSAALDVNDEQLYNLRNTRVAGDPHQLMFNARLVATPRHLPFSFGESFDRLLKSAIEGAIPDVAASPRRLAERLEFRSNADNEWLRVYPNGTIEYVDALRCAHSDAPPAWRPIDPVEAHRAVRRMVTFADAVYGALGYGGTIYLGVQLANVNSRAVAWPATTSGARPPSDRVEIEPADTIPFSVADFKVGDPFDPIALGFLMRIAWKTGYTEYESYIDRWRRGARS